MRIGIRQQNFSLIELLVVMAVFMFLVSLVNPALQKTIQHSLLVKCKSNLKAVYASILLYTEDNRGVCPGPSWDGQVARIYGSKNQIAEFIAPYLKVNIAENGDFYTAAMVCPSNKEIITNRPYFNRQNFLTFSIDDFGRPFGRPEPSLSSADPKLFTQVPNPMSNIVLMEADYKNYPHSGQAAMPALPVHFNTTRNVLYFDGHLDQELGL